MPFLGYLFHDRFGIYGYGFQQFFAFSGFMGVVFCKNLFIGELLWYFWIYGYDFQKILQIYGCTFEKFLRIYGWYFYDLNGTTPYLGNSSYPPPPGGDSILTRVEIHENMPVSSLQRGRTKGYLASCFLFSLVFATFRRRAFRKSPLFRQKGLAD